MMYAVEYRRFYLRDLEYIMVWPSRLWLWRLVILEVLFLVLAAVFWQRVNFTAGAIVGGVGLAWAAKELALGPAAVARIRTTGAIVDLPLVARTRRARKVLATIDGAVRAARGEVEQPTAPETSAQPAEPFAQTNSETPSGTASIRDATQTNGS